MTFPASMDDFHLWCPCTFHIASLKQKKAIKILWHHNLSPVALLCSRAQPPPFLLSVAHLPDNLASHGRSYQADIVFTVCHSLCMFKSILYSFARWQFGEAMTPPLVLNPEKWEKLSKTEKSDRPKQRELASPPLPHHQKLLQPCARQIDSNQRQRTCAYSLSLLCIFLHLTCYTKSGGNVRSVNAIKILLNFKTHTEIVWALKLKIKVPLGSVVERNLFLHNVPDISFNVSFTSLHVTKLT